MLQGNIVEIVVKTIQILDTINASDSKRFANRFSDSLISSPMLKPTLTSMMLRISDKQASSQVALVDVG